MGQFGETRRGGRLVTVNWPGDSFGNSRGGGSGGRTGATTGVAGACLATVHPNARTAI